MERYRNHRRHYGGILEGMVARRYESDVEDIVGSDCVYCSDCFRSRHFRGQIM